MESKSGYPSLPSAPYSEDGTANPPSYAQATKMNPQENQPMGFNPVPQQTAVMHPVPLQQTHVVQNIIVQQAVGPDSTRLTCPSCHTPVSTRIKYANSIRTHLFALLCCVVCCPCFCLPYCMDSCKNTNHYCPNCGCFIGSYRQD